MKIDIRLKSLLKGAGLDDRGTLQQIADEIGAHRHTIARLYRNASTHPSLEVVQRVCEWLQGHGVKEPLPQALFGVRPTELWKALAEQAVIRIVIGEYRELVREGPAHRWIALPDAEALAAITTAITGLTDIEGRPRLSMLYVPFLFGGSPGAETAHRYEDLVASSARLFKKLKAETGATMIIGSQRVNLLLEHFVADLFGVKPFKAPGSRSRRVPFYLQFYPDPARPFRSCFGGAEPLPGAEGAAGPGTFWRARPNRWDSFAWIQNQQDAGIVITVYYPGTKAFHLALFGFSGRGTAILATKLCRDPGEFWKPEARGDGRVVGVYICKFTVKKTVPAGEEASAELKDNDCKVIPLSKSLLERYVC